MINPEGRLCAGGSVSGPGLPMTWDFFDIDTRRWVQLEGPTEVYFHDDDDVGRDRAWDAMQSAVDELDQGAVKITVSAEGKVLSRSTLPEDDITPVTHYPPFTPDAFNVKPSEVVRRQQLTELDRVASCIDVVEVHNTPGRKLMFKYVLGAERETLARVWKEAFITRRLLGHRNVVPFKHFVIDSQLSAFLGYTTAFIPGGDIVEISTTTTTIKLRWFQELMRTIDELNFKYDIIHQDIALRNILLDEEQDCLRLCDFALATHLGSPDHYPEQDDAKMLVFSIYELITGDLQYVKQHPSRFHIESVVNMKKWPARAGLRLEPGITTERLRTEVIEWMEKRKAAPPSYRLTPITWPAMPDIGVYDNIPRTWSQTETQAEIDEYPLYLRRVYRMSQIDPKQYVIRWARPSYKALQRMNEVKK